MITISDLEKIDKSEMYKVYEKWPIIARESYISDIEKISEKNIDHIVFSGMGGSGAIGDIFSSILSKKDIHVKVVKEYHLPNTVDKNTLVVSTSVSGNTMETIKVLKEATKKNCKTICFTSGGKIEKFCLKNKVNFRKIEKYHSPRSSFTSYLYSILNVLQPLLPLKRIEIIESINIMEKISKNISSRNLNSNNYALSISDWLSGIPVIYYPWGLESAAIRFKNSLQENAKTHVFAEDILEMTHNGIISWEKKSNVKPILIRGVNDFMKTKERFEIVKEFFDINKIEYKEIFSEPGGILTKLVNLIYLLDYVSIYYSIKIKTNPSPVKSIEFIKSRLK